MKSIISYNNPLTLKKIIFKENQDKCLIYRWVNKINKNTYIGSTTSFYSRFYKYYNLNYINKKNDPICKALANHGHENFELEILEYCDRPEILEREQYYLDLLNPEYNVLKKAGSSLGFKHSKETIELFKSRKLNNKNSKNMLVKIPEKILSEKEKTKLPITNLGKKLSMLTRKRISEKAIELRGVSVLVKDTISGEKIKFKSLTSASKHLEVSPTAIRKCITNNNLLKKRYKIELI